MARETNKIKVRVPGEDGEWELTPLETSPCTLACPTRINARGYVSLIADGRFAEALTLIRERNPFPGVCGRVCPRPCEAACTRGRYDDAVAICALKRFVADVEMKRGLNPASPVRIHRAEKVAVVGAGPAGLSAANELARLGYPVTIFEAKSEPGGMMNLIPGFRLPPKVVEREARAILDGGIELVTGTEFGKDVTWNTLKRRGFKAILVSTGAWRPVWKWGAPGAKGVFHAIDFLRNAALEVEDRQVAVAGDGMMALDAARTALRLGAKRVALVIGRSRELAPVHRDDLVEAEREGVKVLFLARPSRLVVRGSKLVGVRFVRMKESAPDATGRRAVCEISGSEFTGEFDVFIDAYARGIDVALARASKLGLKLTDAGTVCIDPGTSGAGSKGVFAAGDLVTGPRSVVEAIASGQKAAYGIHEYLSGERIHSPLDLTADESMAGREFNLERLPESKKPRQPMPLEGAKASRSDFREVEKGYQVQVARREAQRCLRCGPCTECALCVDICEKKDLLLRVSDDLSIDVHAGREFWSRMPERVTIAFGDETAEAAPVRTICVVNETLCTGCGRCEEVCEYKAVHVEARPDGGFVARVDELACKGCGTCAAVCATGGIGQLNFESSSIRRQLDSIGPSRSKVLFACHWAKPATVDLPEDVVLIETMCAGRVSPSLILDALLRGASSVMICACRENECHYGFGQRTGMESLDRSRELLELFGYDAATLVEEHCGRDDFSKIVGKWARKSK
jgi:NADPH-dependent glutamate synthase beta subunit-like oxidoreductase/coenzyme F420-reducing hydrogenase delta subunit/NAD-dependent dihydropyrimidine dehydrogenase PreA subunit